VVGSGYKSFPKRLSNRSHLRRQIIEQLVLLPTYSVPILALVRPSFRWWRFGADTDIPTPHTCFKSGVLQLSPGTSNTRRSSCSGTTSPNLNISLLPYL